MSLLTIIQDAANLLSIPSPTAVVGSTDVQVLQLYAIANEEGRELASRFDWQILVQQKTFVTTATPDQTGAVPTDWAKFVQDSFFDRTTRRQLIGPITPQVWQAIQAQPQINSVFLAFRQRDGAFLITPTPPAGDTIAYEYVSKNWCESASLVPQPSFQADTDTAFLDEWLITLGVRWRFRKSKNLDYAEDFRTYETQKQVLQASDVGGGRINQTGRNLYNPLYANNIQVGNFPG